MAKNEVIKLTLDIQTKVGDLESEVAKMQKSFSKLSAPATLTKDIKDAFDDLDKRLNEVKQRTQNNELKLVDEKKVQAELKAIEKDYDVLTRKISNNQSKFSLAKASKEAVSLKQAIEDYNAEIGKGTQKVQDQLKKVQELNDKITRAQNDIATATQVRQNAEQDLKVLEQEEKQLKAVVDQIRAQKQAQYGSSRSTAQIESYTMRTKEGQQYTKVLQDIANAKQNLANATTNYNSVQTRANNTIATAQVNLTNAQTTLQQYQTDLNNLKVTKLDDIKNTLAQIAQNNNLNFGFDISKIQSIDQLEQELSKIEQKDLSQVTTALAAMLAAAQQGQKGIQGMGDAIDQASNETKQFNNELEQIKNRITHFFGLANAVNLFRRAVRSAYETVKDLDKVMTETAVVTSFDVGDMWEQLPEYTERANQLGVSIHDAYEAATLYYQQGLKTNEVMAVSNETLKMARIAGLDAAESTDRMTNALRGFNMAITETNAQKINDVYSHLAAKTASNVDEISTAMTKVASLANNANMSFENTTAFLSQIIETTRESAETAGTALKTVIARFSEVKNLYSEGELLGELEGEEIDVNKVSKALRTAGINLNEYLTGMKGLDDIFMELSSKWDSLDQVQQRYIATMAAGSRQQSRFIALMQDYSRMTELVSEANNAAGASQGQFEKTLESLQTKLNQLKNAWNTFLMGIADNEAIKFLIDALTNLISTINKVLSGLNGVPKSLASIAVAIGGFKLGRSILNKLLGNIKKSLGLQELVKKLTGDLGQGIKKNSGNIASGIVGSLRGSLGKLKGSSAWADFRNAFGKQLSNNMRFSIESVDLTKMTQSSINRLSANFRAQLKKMNLGSAAKKSIVQMIDGTAEGLQKAQAEVQKYGESFTGYTDRLTKADKKTVEAQANMGKMTATLTAAGAAVLLVGTILDKVLGKNMKWLTNGIKALGISLMVIPNILKAIEASGVAAGINIQAAFGWISIVLAAIVGIGVALASLAKQNSPAEKLKRAQEAAQAAADAANEAAEAYKNLGDSFDELGDKYKKLEDLIEGTQEWREAVFEINQQVLELIKNYPALSDLVTNKNGVLKIDLNSAEVQGVMNDYFKQSVEASSTAAAMQIRALQQRNENNYDTLHNVGFENGRTLHARARYKSSYGGSYHDDRQLTEDIAKQIATGQLLTSSEIANYAASFGASIDTTEKSIEALRAFGEALIEVEKQTDALAASMALDAIQLAGIEGKNSTYASEFLGTGVINEINKRISNEVEDKASAFIGANSLKYDTKYKDFWEKRYGSVTIDRYGKVSYYDSEKGQQTIDAELARQEYAAAKATEEMADAAEKFVNIISKAETSQEIKNLFGDKEGRALTQADINKWTSSSGTVHGGGNTDGKSPFQKAMEELYQSIYGDKADLNSEEFKAFLDKAQTDLEIAQKRWEKATVSINNTLGKVPTKVETMTTGQAEGIGKVLSETMLVNGKGAAQEMWNLISKVGGEQTSKLAEAFSFIDFNNIDSIEDLEGVLEDLNLSSLTTEDGFDDLKAMLLDVAKASQQVDLQKVKKAIEELSSIRAKFLKGEATRTWSKEEFESMQSYLSQDILKDFVEDEDGNYIYLGDRMDDLRKAIEDNTFALRGEEITSLENQANAKDILNQNINWGLNQWQYGTIEGITDTQHLPLEARQQIFEQYLKQLQALPDEQFEGLGLGIGRETKLQDIIDEGKFEEYWEKFINLANNAALDAQIEQLEKDKAVAALSGITNNAEVAKAEDQDAALGQLKLRAYKAGMGDELYQQYNTGNIGELASMVTAYQEAQSLSIDTAKLEEYATLLRDTNKNLEDNITLSTQVALANTKLNDGLREIVDSYKDWTELINEDGLITPTTQEETEAFNKLKDSVNKMLNASEPLTDEFWQQKENLELLKEAAEGNVEALEDLQKASTIDYLDNLTLTVNTTEAYQAVTDFLNYLDGFDLNYEVGFQLDGDADLVSKFNEMVQAANLSADQIAEAAKRMGFSAEVEYVRQTRKIPKVNKKETPSLRQIGYNPTTFEPLYETLTSTTTWTSGYDEITDDFPVVKTLTANGSGGGGVSVKTINAGKQNKPSSSSGNSGSSGSSSKPSYWKNPYDELYNLNEKINESLRKRQALERQYQKLIKSDASTIGDIRKAYRDQISMMQQQINLQRQLAQGRLNQINNLANQYYTDSEGRRRTYASMGVTQYAHYNTETGEITIDWDALEAIANDASRSEEGAAAEAYINALQELVSSYEETRDAIWEIEDAIEDLNKELVDSYLSFEDRVLDALVASYEREIDSLEKINDTINDATSKMLDSMREQIDAQRQERENAKTEEEIARMEARLAYLRQDTSGANSLEIMQLEKELEDARQNYEDSLIDQALEQMQKDADLAAEQRAQQIEVMRAQLQMAIENGELWDQVYALIANAWEGEGHLNVNSDLVALLQQSEAFQSLSEVGQAKWWDDYTEAINSFVAGIQSVFELYGDQLSDELLQILQAIGGIREDIVTNTPTVPVGGGGNAGGGNTGGNNGGSGNTGGNTGGGGNSGNTGGNTPTIPRPKISQTSGVLRLGDYNDNVLLLRQALVGLGIRDFSGWPITDAAHTLEPKRFDEQLEQGVINFQRSFNWGGAIDADGKVGSNTRKKFKRAGYKTGGLADFTGPAWLDGTRTHPELVLNARDTENFISLKNILAGLMTPEANNGTFGKNDTYIDIDINADIGSDYDVQQLANEVKRQIVRDANYRNVNTINFMR